MKVDYERLLRIAEQVTTLGEYRRHAGLQANASDALDKIIGALNRESSTLMQTVAKALEKDENHLK